MKKHFSNEEKAIDIHLYTAPTMNGWKPVILLEELGVNYKVTHVAVSYTHLRAHET